MKIYARITNEKGKTDGMGADEYLDIDITIGNTILAKLTVRRGDIPEANKEGWILFDAWDEPLFWLEDEKLNR